MREAPILHYLDGLRGTRVLSAGDKPGTRVDYDIDAFSSEHGQMRGSGEICAAPLVMQRMFGCGDLKLLTEDGRLLSLVFSDKKLGSIADAAPIDVTGELPSECEHAADAARAGVAFRLRLGSWIGI